MITEDSITHSETESTAVCSYKHRDNDRDQQHRQTRVEVVDGKAKLLTSLQLINQCLAGLT